MAPRDVIQGFSDGVSVYERATVTTRDIANYGLTHLPPMDSSSVVHDNGCGPGVVSFLIADMFSNDTRVMPQVFATDLAPGMVKATQAEVARRELKSRMTTQVLDARDLSAFEDATFTHSIMNFAIMGDDGGAPKMASERYRTLTPGGAIMVTTFHRSAPYVLEQVSLRSRPTHEPKLIISKAWETKEKLVDTLVDGGFDRARVNVYSKKGETDFGSEDGRFAFFKHPIWGQWTEGWSDDELAQVDNVLREELVAYGGEGGRFWGQAWIAIATK